MQVLANHASVERSMQGAFVEPAVVPVGDKEAVVESYLFLELVYFLLCCAPS